MSVGLRVAIYAETYLPYLSGVTVSTETLARGLKAAGHEVLLIAPRPADGAAPGTAGAPGPEPDYAWLPSYQAPPPAPPGYRMPWPLPGAALDVARAFTPDIVHAQSPFVTGLMARRLAQGGGPPLVFTHHTRFGDYGHYLGPLAGAARRGVGAYLADFWRGCAAIVAPGTELADEIAAALVRPGPMVRMIPTGVDVAAIQALSPVDIRAEHGWPPDAIVAVSMGRLAKEKNLALLLEAFATAAASHDRLRFLLVGGGPGLDLAVERAGQPDLAGRLAVTGRLPRLDAIARVRACDVFAFASQTETQGLVLAESLAAGVPVLALAGPGVNDSVRDGVDGVILTHDANQPASGARALAAALAELASDEARRRRFGAAAAAGAGRFAIERRVEEMTVLYGEVLGRTAGAAAITTASRGRGQRALRPQ
jgi:1,2-diacylglycerol 3-alpha-glucosyltransferase